jgi:hypothetical protein
MKRSEVNLLLEAAVLVVPHKYHQHQLLLLLNMNPTIVEWENPSRAVSIEQELRL